MPSAGPLPPPPPRRRYRFGAFVLSPAQRALVRDGRVVTLIPRYLDLLLLLVERRGEAVHRNALFDTVWSDVVVSDGALSQAVRSLRRALDDDPREPRFIRTVSRHGYQFVFPQVIEEADGDPALDTTLAPARGDLAAASPRSTAEAHDAFERALAQLLGGGDANGNGEVDARREAAETLHALGTAEALRRLDARPGHARARALLRDARWDVPGAGPVPIWGQPAALLTSLHLAALRLGRALREVEARWAGAAGGGALAGLTGGLAGGLILWLGPGSRASGSVCIVLGLLGALVGGFGAAGVGAGLAAAEAVFRSLRGVMLVVMGALGGGAIGSLAHAVAAWTLTSLFGRSPSPLAGGLEGLAIGAGSAFGYALATHPTDGGMAAPRGSRRLVVATLSGFACGAAALVLALTGHHSGAMSLEILSRSFPGSQVGLEPLARLLGEATPGVTTRLIIGAGEGFLFGAGLAFGLTRRPR